MRDHILQTIRRLAEANGGQPPGLLAFASQSGIREHEWLGVYWARWSDALTEAGFTPNDWQGRRDPEQILQQLAEIARHFRRMPTTAELTMYKRDHPGTPVLRTLSNHFGGMGAATDKLREWVATRAEFADVAGLLGPASAPAPTTAKRVRTSQADAGFVYLIRSGEHHKIGRSEELERRVKQIRVALPAAAVQEHAIRTDDPVGIEAYWHRRFADRRANGEWFKLTSADITAFKRRTFQ